MENRRCRAQCCQRAVTLNTRHRRAACTTSLAVGRRLLGLIFPRCARICPKHVFKLICVTTWSRLHPRRHCACASTCWAVAEKSYHYHQPPILLHECNILCSIAQLNQISLSSNIGCPSQTALLQLPRPCKVWSSCCDCSSIFACLGD